MSQPAAQALDLSFDLVYSDGVPLDSNWERVQMNLLIDVIRQAMAERFYEPRTEELEGFRLAGDRYVPLLSDAEGRIWSESDLHPLL